jgi:hypothetical protein
LKETLIFFLTVILLSFQAFAQNNDKEKDEEEYSAILDEEYKKIETNFDAEFPTPADREDFRKLREFRNAKSDALLTHQTKLHYLITFKKQVQSDLDQYKIYLETFNNYIDNLPDLSNVNLSYLFSNNAYWSEPRTVRDVKNKLIIPYKEHIKDDSIKLSKAQSALFITKCNVSTLSEDVKKCDRAIDAALVPEIKKQHDRTSISLIFAGLVLILMAMFFAVVYLRSDKDLSSMLLTDGGLQFVTIFILIIAIILFGILNILEGRELAAIISGISGYILGRNAKIPSVEKQKPEASKDNQEELENNGSTELKVKS